MRTTLVMRKKSAIIASAIAAILTTSVLAFANLRYLPRTSVLANQVFAECCEGMQIFVQPPREHITLNVEESETQAGKVLAGHETHIGKTLEGQQDSHPGLGCNIGDPHC